MILISFIPATLSKVGAENDILEALSHTWLSVYPESEIGFCLSVDRHSRNYEVLEIVLIWRYK